ncbi:MAG: 3-carboxymuconate cyclase, partial [SAR324 cluster bacterium]|nr:3-carboxymuconate cyclase [SAR324 cluster bacterium]
MLLFFSPGCAPKEESSSDTSGGGGSTTTYHTLQLNVSGLGGIIIVSSRGGNGNVYNKSEAMAVTSNGTHNFSGIPSGTSYNVTILQQPLYQTCTVSNGSGTLNGNQTVAISCDGTVTIGGKVYGLNGTITLQNNAGNDLTISSNGNFVFTDNLSMGSSYLVTVASQPANGPTCTPNNNSGVATDNITSVEIICSQTLRSISGSINHLSGTLVLQNNFGGDQTFTSNDNFTFNVADNSSYNVTVKSQPAGKCIVSNGTGTASDNVSNVSVDCW